VSTDYLLGRTPAEHQTADKAAPAPQPTKRPRRRTAAPVG
jgi:hypothetical protein